MGKPRDFSFTFAGAGEREFQAKGRYVRVIETSVSDAFFSLDHGPELQRGAGQQIADSDPTGFSHITVRSAVAQVVRFTVADVPQDDNRSNVALSVSATVAGATANTPKTIVTVPAGGSAKVADSNADRIELRLAIASDQPGPIYLGDAGIAAGEGGILEPGMADYLATVAEVWAFNPGASDVDVTVLDLEAP